MPLVIKAYLPRFVDSHKHDQYPSSKNKGNQKSAENSSEVRMFKGVEGVRKDFIKVIKYWQSNYLQKIKTYLLYGVEQENSELQ